MRKRTAFQTFIRCVRRGNSDVQQGARYAHREPTGQARVLGRDMQIGDVVSPAAKTVFESDCAGPVAITVISGKRRLLLSDHPKNSTRFGPAKCQAKRPPSLLCDGRPTTGCGFWRCNDVCRTVRKNSRCPDFALLCPALVVASCCFKGNSLV